MTTITLITLLVIALMVIYGNIIRIHDLEDLKLNIENQRNSALRELQHVTHKDYFFDDNNKIQIWEKY